MSARDRYLHIFGEIDSLDQVVPWTTGLGNMLEWILWTPKVVLGVSKTQYWQEIVDWCSEPQIRRLPTADKKSAIKKRLDAILKLSEQPQRYSKPARGIVTAREALRCAKYFSEDYLNKEFDIFWSLVSDRYLDEFYEPMLAVRGGGRWSTQGNSGLFKRSTGIREMQMDNIAYNASEKLLIANELKLGGKKNPDQILKYAYMFSGLKQRRFIASEDRFALVFISDAQEPTDWEAQIDRELEYCRDKGKAVLCDRDNERVARSVTYATMRWTDLLEFNGHYLSRLPKASQVERKLLEGFNASLREKSFMNESS